MTSVRKSAWELHVEASDTQFECEEISLGALTSYSLIHDPKHLSFVLGRYKFVAKMLEGKERVVEIGCGDGFGVPLVAQTVGSLLCVDWEQRSLESCSRRLKHLKNVSYVSLDFNTDILSNPVDAIYLIDVWEHLDPENEDRFMQNICKSLKPDGTIIIGTPNISSNAYASEHSRMLHINLKSLKELKNLVLKYFVHAFPFGMNDEVLHTGYDPMCHYIWAIGAGLRL